FGRVYGESAVWALAVVVRDIGAEYSFEVAAAEDQQPVETFGADGADEALGVGVCPWCADGRVDHFDPLAAEDLVEGGSELAVAVMDQKAHALEHACEAEIARLLGDPGAGRAGRAAGEVHATTPKFDEEEHVEAAQRDRLDREKVTGEHARGLLAQEFRASSARSASAPALNRWQAGSAGPCSATHAGRASVARQRSAGSPSAGSRLRSG